MLHVEGAIDIQCSDSEMPIRQAEAKRFFRWFTMTASRRTTAKAVQEQWEGGRRDAVLFTRSGGLAWALPRRLDGRG